MRKGSAGLVALLGICAASPFVDVLASSGHSRIVYDDGHGAIVITAPQGWTFEHDTSREEGLRAVVHPLGMTPPKASTVMYLRTVPKNAQPTDFESVVYLDAPAVYVTITLTSKTRTAHEESQAALSALVKSYHVSTVKGAVRR